MDFIKNKKIIAIVVILVILFTISIISFKRNNTKTSYDEYINEIFVEDENLEVITDSQYTNNTQRYIVVEIKGEVVNPDVYQLEEGSIIKDLIEIAGGLTDKANISNINRAKKLQNHELIIVNNNEQPITSQLQNNVIQDDIININLATLEQLKTISGIGDVKAQSIIDYREKNNGFKSIDEIKNIDGIGEKTFEKIKDKITF